MVAAGGRCSAGCRCGRSSAAPSGRAGSGRVLMALWAGSGGGGSGGGLVVLALGLLGGALASPQAAAPPNIFFILVDGTCTLSLSLRHARRKCHDNEGLTAWLRVWTDLGYADVGFNRAKPDREVVTPNLNELVATGVHLTRHCAQITAAQPASHRAPRAFRRWVLAW
jgi:hypothetical protein